MLRVVQFVVLLAGGGLVPLAQASTNHPIRTPWVEPASLVERIRLVLESTAELRPGLTNHPTALECVNSKQSQLQALLDVSESCLRRLRVLQQLTNSPQQEERLDEERSRIFVAYSRAERLGNQALDCLPAELSIHTTHALENAAGTGNVAPLVPASTGRRLLENREGACVTQGEAARLLALAMELVIDARQEALACAELAENKISPPGGWQPAQCLYVDDLYVIAAQALRLKVTDADNPLSSASALRAAGLPIDSILPPHIPDRQVPVLEPELRAFLALGRAARP